MLTRLAVRSLHEAFERNDWADVEAIYPNIPTSILSHHDTFLIAKLLHTTLRINGSARDAAGQEANQKLLLATDRLVDLYKARVLPPHSGASLHLLSIYKENKEAEKTKELWHWLSIQEGDEYVSQAVYGAAIEALAFAGEPLADLETLFEKALIRFPGNFASYHLSPEAVVPDRGQSAFSKNIPISLLQGIFTARLLNDDWRNAYLAFDVVLRLIPEGIPRRFFELIIAQRPFAEAVQVYQLGILVKALSTDRSSITLLGRAAVAVERVSGQQRAHIAKDAIGILEAEIYARRPLLSTQVSRVINILTHMAWDNKLCDTDAMKLRNFNIAECGSRLIKLCSPYMLGDIGSTLNSMLQLAGKTNHKQLVVEIREVIEELDTWNDVTHRALVSCVGAGGDIDGLKDAWKLLVKRAEQESRELGERDWWCLARAVNSINSPIAVAFATEQLALHNLSPQFQARFQEACQPWPGNGKEIRKPTKITISSEMEVLGEVLDKLEARTRFPDVTDVYRRPDRFSKGTNTLSGESNVAAPATNAQIVYDELTVDPLQPSPDKEAQLSKAGLPFDTLRFIHWKSVNDLLLLAEGCEKAKKAAAEEAIATGTPLKFDKDRESLRLYDELSFPLNLEEYRLRIMELRGRAK
ncbi:hypothetical protein BLS_007787 [Venturia inaequalis]|uniref:Uncharacterized protein n=1 Tax=Venturia inaequalis TaxID=5025 RepID=A0A8H3V4A9_VENIN|nr:hypothetical protein BLS_007787 [Venturia inaequalis]